MLRQQIAAVGAKQRKVGRERAVCFRLGHEVFEQHAQQREFGGGGFRPFDQLQCFQAREGITQAGFSDRLGDMLFAEHQPRRGMQRIEEQPGGWRVRAKPCGIRGE